MPNLIKWFLSKFDDIFSIIKDTFDSVWFCQLFHHGLVGMEEKTISNQTVTVLRKWVVKPASETNLRYIIFIYYATSFWHRHICVSAQGNIISSLVFHVWLSVEIVEQMLWICLSSFWSILFSLGGVEIMLLTISISNELMKCIFSLKKMFILSSNHDANRQLFEA